MARTGQTVQNAVVGVFPSAGYLNQTSKHGKVVNLLDRIEGREKDAVPDRQVALERPKHDRKSLCIREDAEALQICFKTRGPIWMDTSCSNLRKPESDGERMPLP